ncbi:dTDP-4-dehydrorhamnose 3,5-epimerase [Vibrio cholerae]|uniref:dTDP-4-dehydrorhamnose 3,5-epimerase n=1 Tax=Vibrio cholerae TaxID=666 RepID=UPI000E0B3014|nr:dTDP-4-dehydrorhamnose 3,5-epimerase [Vibrio cholerae]
MKIIQTNLKDCVLIEPDVYGDERGYFFESFHVDKYHALGISETFVQDNFSKSSKGILRGLHSQIKKPQGKLVQVTRGCVFDVAVDLREESQTFGKYFSVILSGENHKQLYIPPGFAHGFLTLSEEAHFSYKCTEFYDPEDELGIIWNDETLGIDWPVDVPIISKKDKEQPTFQEYISLLKDLRK